MNTERKPYTPREIDDTEDRMGSIEQLDFSDRQDERQGRVGDDSPDALGQTYPDDRVREAGMSGGETLGEGIHEDGVSMDDASPETLIDETGARSPREKGDDMPADMSLSEVGPEDIGGGSGLDEAELGRKRPLDGERWDGDPNEPLVPEATLSTDDELAGDEAIDSARRNRDGGAFGD